MEVTTIGLDLAKNVFEAHGVLPPYNCATLIGLLHDVSLPPTLDHLRQEILASSAGWLAGNAAAR